MAGRIPRTFIDDLIDRADIVDVVDSRVKLKRAGKNYSACCPFHQEKTPSFTVSPDKQFYYCFGCGASGNALGFVMEFERLDFVGAVESLAKDMGVEVPREKPEPFKPGSKPKGDFGAPAKVRNPLYTLLETAQKQFKQHLRNHESAPKAVEYLKGRGLTGEIANQFGIGLAPPGWANLLDAINPEKDQKITDQLIECGMVVHNPDSDKIYDRFRDRVMFPIRDIKGRIIGFGGRVLGDEKPKYLNSPETPVFSKGKELYGLFEARKATRKLERLVVVEGYMDVVALAQHGITYGVATLGTATSTDHLDRMFKYVKQVVFCFDGDQAGRMAARRALDNALPGLKDGREIRFLFLPDGEDPDTLVRSQGADAFIKLVEDAMPLSQFLLDAVGQDLDLDSVDGRARLATEAAPSMAKIPEGVFRSLMIGELSQKTGLDRPAIEHLVEQAVEKEAARARAREARETREPGLRTDNEAQDNVQQTASHVSAQTPADTHSVITGVNADYGYAPPTDYDDPGMAIPPSDYDHMPPTSYDFVPGEIDSESHWSPQNTPVAASSGKRIHLDSMTDAISILLHKPNLAQDIEVKALESVNNSRAVLLKQLVELLKKKPYYSLQQVIAAWRAVHGHHAAEELAQIAQNVPPIDRQAYASTLQQAIDQMGKQQSQLSAEQEIRELSSRTLSSLTDDERQRLLKLLADAPKYRGK